MSAGLQSEPPRLERGPKFLQNWANMVIDWLVESQVLPGLGVTISNTPKGRVVNARGKGGSGGSATADQVPFEVLDATTPTTDQVRIRLGVLKSNGTAWIPTGMFPGDTPPLIMPIVGTSGYVYLIVNVDGNGDTTSVLIGIDETQPADSTSAGHLTLGTYGVDDEGNLVVASEDVGAQAHLFCGIEHHFAKA